MILLHESQIRLAVFVYIPKCKLNNSGGIVALPLRGRKIVACKIQKKNVQFNCLIANSKTREPDEVAIIIASNQIYKSKSRVVS